MVFTGRFQLPKEEEPRSQSLEYAFHHGHAQKEINGRSCRRKDDGHKTDHKDTPTPAFPPAERPQPGVMVGRVFVVRQIDLEIPGQAKASLTDIFDIQRYQFMRKDA